MSIILLLVVLFLIDLYAYQAILTVTKGLGLSSKSIVRIGYWLITALVFSSILWYYYGNPYKYGSQLRNLVLVGIFMTYFSKVFGLLFIIMDDIQRGVRWVAGLHLRHSGPN